jgi:hypothetical protein
MDYTFIPNAYREIGVLASQKFETLSPFGSVSTGSIPILWNDFPRYYPLHQF